ncbi:uncharacterized protein LOC120153030 [Hibiscus syriacus]|uniref:uncharacterized protein LOC120153030 n=1 Tax=Hibiscus syriacus TaxID=106335 RepID=UPI0019208682|nr:uncharacterized protein LOC120153030 [Hibiscus syriacus]
MSAEFINFSKTSLAQPIRKSQTVLLAYSKICLIQFLEVITIKESQMKSLPKRFMKLFMAKLISPNQSAFVKGSSIIDNTLIAQDIVKGYRRKNLSPRCAIKIYLQKAFDSVHWGIIPIILKALNLPTYLIDRIVACYSNATYSIAFNGSLIGFFKGAKAAKGIFNFHPKCKKIGLTHLTFADDLLIFYKGNLESVLGIITVLNSSYELSGIKLNALKSEIFTTVISAQVIDNIISYSGFKHGLLPIRYLGIPLVTRKLSPKDCQPLLDKIYSRLNQWSRLKLSYAGRIELVKIVLISVANFLYMQLILPQSVIHKIEQICSIYFWKGSDILPLELE